MKNTEEDKVKPKETELLSTNIFNAGDPRNVPTMEETPGADADDEGMFAVNGKKDENKKSSATVAPLSKENVEASVVAKDSGTNLIQKLETTKESYKKVTKTRGFITDISQDLGLEQHESLLCLSC